MGYLILILNYCQSHDRLITGGEILRQLFRSPDSLLFAPPCSSCLLLIHLFTEMYFWARILILALKTLCWVLINL